MGVLAPEMTYTLFHVHTKTSGDNRKQFNGANVEFGGWGEKKLLNIVPHEYGRKKTVEFSKVGVKLCSCPGDNPLSSLS